MVRNSWGSPRKLPSGRWQARYIGPDGRQHKAATTFSNKANAHAWLASERRLVELQAWTAPADRHAAAQDGSGPTVEQWLKQCILDRERRNQAPLKQTTADNYRRLVRLYITGTELAGKSLIDVTRADVTKWRWNGAVARVRTAGGKAYEFLASAFNDAVKAGHVPATPCTLDGAGAPEREREPQALSVPELRAYLDAVPAPWARAALLLSASCALRIGEVLALRRRDLDLEASTVTVSATVAKLEAGDGTRTRVSQKPKTKAASRTLALIPSTVDELRDWLATTRDDGPEQLLFGDALGKELNDDTLRRIHKKAAAAIGRPELRNHDLRSTGANLAAHSGATTREIQNMLGHTTPSMALRYQVPTVTRDRERAKRMGEEWRLSTPSTKNPKSPKNPKNPG